MSSNFPSDFVHWGGKDYRVGDELPVRGGLKFLGTVNEQNLFLDKQGKMLVRKGTGIVPRFQTYKGAMPIKDRDDEGNLIGINNEKYTRVAAGNSSVLKFYVDKEGKSYCLSKDGLKPMSGMHENAEKLGAKLKGHESTTLSRVCKGVKFMGRVAATLIGRPLAVIGGGALSLGVWAASAAITLATSLATAGGAVGGFIVGGVLGMFPLALISKFCGDKRPYGDIAREMAYGGMLTGVAIGAFVVAIGVAAKYVCGIKLAELVGIGALKLGLGEDSRVMGFTESAFELANKDMQCVKWAANELTQFYQKIKNANRQATEGITQLPYQ